MDHSQQNIYLYNISTNQIESSAASHYLHGLDGSETSRLRGTYSRKEMQYSE